MLATWVIKNRCSVPFNVWQGFVSDAAAFDSPITIKIRSRAEIQKLYKKAGFRVHRYWKRGFVQKYLPVIGKLFQPDGVVLNACGSLLGWYHVFIFKKSNDTLAMIKIIDQTLVTELC